MKMQNAEMEFVTFDAQDVIATSGGSDSVVLANFGNGILKDSTFTFGGKTYGMPDIASKNSMVAALNEYFSNINITTSTIFDDKTIQDLYNYNYQEALESAGAKYNGKYVWGTDRFVKQ